ncbi:hypothetical protein E2C01_051367 [Portunus trituberculatus]|uniref:Uncharacterized protein n=1 Tax=Portunus trituberculatus TaxID=210409 RepID=A0A5B7GK47_PORTR|nr:hypothetical protein [Portunus trituberculatus]
MAATALRQGRRHPVLPVTNLYATGGQSGAPRTAPLLLHPTKGQLVASCPGGK